jgi:outer membrane lipoprotein LolB
MQRRFFLLSLLVLAGCATNAPLPSAVRVYRDSLTLTGRLSVSYRHNDKPQSLQGKFRWAQRPERTEIELSSPLGQTLARITITPGHAWLQQSGGEIREAASVDALTEEALGWPLPVEGLRFWLQGYIRDAGNRLHPVMPADAEGMRSDGWRMRFVSWHDHAGELAPKRIDFTREGLGQDTRSPLSMRIVIDQSTEASQ